MPPVPSVPIRGVMVTGATTPIGERLIRSLLADARIERILAVGVEPEDRALPFAHGDRLVYKSVDLGRSRRVHLGAHVRGFSQGVRAQVCSCPECSCSN